MMKATIVTHIIPRSGESDGDITCRECPQSKKISSSSTGLQATAATCSKDFCVHHPSENGYTFSKSSKASVNSNTQKEFAMSKPY